MNELNNKIRDLFMRAGLPDPLEDETSAQLLQELSILVTEQVRLGKKEERRKLTYAKVDKSVLESDGLKVHFDFKFHDKCSEEHFAVFGVSDEKWSVAIDGQNIVSRLKSDTTLLEGNK